MREPEVRSPLEQFALPHTFAPRMTLWGATVAVFFTLGQILLGCLIAALWGVRIWIAAVSSHWMIWRVAVISVLVVGMAASLAAMMWAARASARFLSGTSD